jgi:DHA3 family macrolide efflux protein-like MFS transporter
VLRDRNITLVILARFVSRAGGTAVFFIGLWGVAAYSYHVSAASLAILMAGNSAAGIVGAVVAGVLVDRLGPKRVLIGAEILTVPAAISLAFAPSYPAFVALAWVFGLVASPTFTAGGAFAPHLAREPRDLERINGAIEAAGSAGFMLGPAMGAVVVQLWGVSAVFWTAGVASALAAAVAWAVSVEMAPRETGQSHPLAELREGLKVAYSVRAIRYGLLVGTAVWFGFGFFSALEPLFYRDVVRVGVEWIGWMNTAFSVGLVAGAWGLSRLPRRVISARGLCVVGALCGLGALAYVGSKLLPVIAAGALAWGLVIGVLEPLLRTVLQMAAPEGYVGRVVGAAMYHREFGELVPLMFAPSLAVLFGVQPVLIGGGVLVAIVLAATWWHAESIDRELAAASRAPGVLAPAPAHIGIGDEIL